jgi:type VI secretion system secreted protein Hcp
MAYTLQLKIDGIEGDQRDGMMLEGFGHNVSAGTGRSAAPMVSDFSFSRICDRATPLLALAAAEGRYFKGAVLELARSDGDKAKFMEIRLTRVRVTNHNISGAPGGDVKAPYENFALGFEKIEWVYITGPSKECRAEWVNEAAVAVH